MIYKRGEINRMFVRINLYLYARITKIEDEQMGKRIHNNYHDR